MEAWFIILVSLCLTFLAKALFNLLLPSHSSPPLPPGPLRVPIIGSTIWLHNPITELVPILRRLHAKYGPIVTLPIGSRPSIFVADRSLAHQALIQNGAVFSTRPAADATAKITTSNQHIISFGLYGPTWRLLRRNLASEMLHPARIKSFSGLRKWVLDMLLSRLKSDSESSGSVQVIGHLHYAMFCLLVSMCFGKILEHKLIIDIEYVQRRSLMSFSKFTVLNFWPSVTRILFRKRWEEFLRIRKEKEDVLLPLIRSRKKVREQRLRKAKEGKNPDQVIVSYVDTLLDLQLPEEKRDLNDGELVSLCSEFLDGGTDTTATGLQWILANLVKYPHIQERLFQEIREVMGERREEIMEVKEEDLKRMPYLKAVILEGLRRHPPGHILLPHAVSEDTVLNNYLVPKNGTINFMVAEIGRDPEVWENPMEFRPERFLKNEEEEAFDITGSKEIKMVPFGVGRRMCPGYHLAMLHLEYFIANLVWNFEWKASNSADVDLSEKREFTVVMKNPLQAHIYPRI
ncbi:hypothetical protein K1719_000521 [Acacia pycnantha]|nr:hypothetical protein K1719_000521 [Acacia pycnantha]